MANEIVGNSTSANVKIESAQDIYGREIFTI